MKLSRRCFLSFVVGGAAGTVLSPMPLKLTDDFAIWSQNWPWTPVPPDGEVGYVDTTCTLCPGGCGISVRKIDDRAVKIEGRQGHPLNQGGVCILGLSGLQMLYSPTRIQQPLKRVGKRGENRWQPISWNQAIAETAAKLKAIRSQGSPQSVAAIMPRDDGSVAQLMKRLLTAYGSPNYMVMPSAQDAYATALRLTQGADGSAGLDVTRADFILSFGSALLDGYGSPVQMFQAVSRLKDIHGTLVQVEPRLSNTAAKADEWLAATPGSEGDLALAMAQVIIAENRFDQTFAGQSGSEFEAFTRLVNSRYTPRKVAKKCAVDAARITKIALAFADAKKPLALCGRGKGQTPGSLKEALAVHTLNALVGNINQAGGVQIKQPYTYIDWPQAAQDSVATAGMTTPRADNAGTGLYAAAGHLPHRFFGNVAKGTAKIQALLVGETNPSYSLPDPQTVKAALDNIPFVVSFSSFMDETAAQADLILPNHIYLERYEDVPVSAGVAQPMVGLCRPVTAPQHNTRHMGDALIQIARALRGTVAQALDWSDYQTCLQETLADQWHALNSKGYITDTAAAKAPAKKFIFMDKALETAYLSKDAPLAGDAAKYPLQLIAFDSIRLASRYAPSAPFMMKTVPDTMLKQKAGWVEINPETAAQQGLSDGQAAVLTTPKGKASVLIHYNHGLMPGLIAMVRGLGHSAHDQFLTGKGTNINSLMGSVEDPASGMDAAWGIRAQLAKA